jgi:hypothetical protein
VPALLWTPLLTDVVVTEACHGTLKPNTACSVRVTFQPTAAGDRQAILVVHVSPGDFAERMTIVGTANDDDEGDPVDPAACRVGFVWRESTADDHTCVTPDDRTAAQNQNVAHAEGDTVNPDGTCVDGFVRRDAVAGDEVCVTQEERDEVLEQNKLHTERVAH